MLKNYASNFALFFIGDGIVVDNATMRFAFPLQKTVDALNLRILSSHLDNKMLIIKCESGLSTEEFSKSGYTVYHIKKFLSEVDTENQQQILKAYHWLNWHSQSKFCGQCGSLLEDKFESTEKRCNICKTSFFPRFSPAVIVLIQKEDRILLARSKHFQPGIYSAVAGFVEIGESAEHAAHREVYEELGIEITDLEYFSSQTWPFPDGFMMAFKANYLIGEIKLDENEIEDARWFNLDDLPKLPSKPSIARQLIDSVIQDYILVVNEEE